MGPETLKLYADRPDLRASLAAAQHWIVDDAMVHSLADISKDVCAENEGWVFQFDLPSDNVVVEMSVPGGVTILQLCGTPDESKVGLNLKFPRSGFFSAGLFYRRSKKWTAPPPLPEWGVEEACCISSVAILADLLFALAAEPRLVRKVAPMRQQRRKVQRAVGFVPAVWKNISWTVGEATTPARKSGHPDHGMPLHIVRAHWRKYPRETARAVRRPGRPGWWTWVPHHFRGHPAYGVKLHRYRPKIGEQSSGVIRDVVAAATQHAATAAIKGWNNGRQDR